MFIRKSMAMIVLLINLAVWDLPSSVCWELRPLKSSYWLNANSCPACGLMSTSISNDDRGEGCGGGQPECRKGRGVRRGKDFWKKKQPRDSGKLLTPVLKLTNFKNSGWYSASSRFRYTIKIHIHIDIHIGCTAELKLSHTRVKFKF